MILFEDRLWDCISHFFLVLGLIQVKEASKAQVLIVFIYLFYILIVTYF
jgi:hypothetical protein